MSIVDHNIQGSVSTVFLKKFRPLTGPGHGANARPAFSHECHSYAGHELRWPLQDADFIGHSFQAGRLGLGALAVIVDNGSHNPHASHARAVCCVSTAMYRRFRRLRQESRRRNCGSSLDHRRDLFRGASSGSCGAEERT